MEKLAIRAAALMLGCLLISASPAAAGLFPDNSVDVTLTLGATTIIDTAIDPGAASAQATVNNVNYRVDLFDDGFLLLVECAVSSCGVLQDGLKLVLEGLDFTPPAALLDVTPDLGNEPEMNPVAGSPSTTSPSVTIEFQDFTADSSGWGATFVTGDVAAVPIPATALLLFAGLGVAAALRRRPGA